MGDDGGVGLCATYEEVNIDVVVIACLLYEQSCLMAIVILTITDGLLHIAFEQTLHNQRVCSLVVVTLELYHIKYTGS
jgi:hypothetical protein